MVLDSGADLIVIGSKAARAAGLSAGSELDLVGLGSRPAKVGQAATVEIGPVAFRNCRVAFVKGNVIEGADGVIPLSLFSGFIVRLNLPEETLDLIPYATNVDPDIQPARGVIRHHRLLVATVLEGKRNGYLVLDTGASCSVISRESARTLGGFPMLPEVRLAAGTGAATGQRISASVHFAIADQDVVLDQVVALDLSNLSRLFGVEILGVLGFPDLSNYVLTIDYAGGQVRMQRHARSWARILQSDENSDLPAVVK